MEPSVSFLCPPNASLVPIPNEINEIHNLTSYFNIIFPSTLKSFSSSVFLSGFPAKTFHAFLFSPKRTTNTAHLSLFGYVTIIITGEE
jgi:hypothetical protein